MLLWGGLAWADSPGASSEADLIARLLAAPAAQASLQAADAAGEAAGTRRSPLPNPTLEARHEEARGSAGASTDILGGAVTLDLGFSGQGEVRAASLRAQAAAHWRHAALVSEVCTLRQGLLSHWSAEQRVTAVLTAQERLEALTAALDTLAQRGEVAGYDRDRARLDVLGHTATVTAAQREVIAQKALLESLLGESIAAVQPAVSASPLPSRASMLEQALSGQPALLALRLERDAAAQSVAAARRSALPDLEISGGARWDAPPTGGAASQGFEIGGTLELPVFDRARVAVREATASQAGLDAQILHAEAAVRAQVEGAWVQASEGQPPSPSSAPADLWSAAQRRYTGGEASIDELLQVSAVVESVQISLINQEHLYRQARLELACAVGHFDEPEIQSVLEAHIP